MPWWHAGFAAVMAGTAVWAGIALRGDLPRLGAVLGLYATWSALYALTMGGPLACSHPRTSHLVYLGGGSALFAAASFLFPATGILLFVLVPQCFMMLEARPAIAASIGLLAVNAGAELEQQGISGGTVTSTVVFGLLGVTLALLLGGYVSRIIEQSRRRAQLIEELDRTRAELAELSREAGALAERERLASDIHDVLAQEFTSVLMLLQAAQAALDRGDLSTARRQLEVAEPAARDGLAEARSLIRSLAPPHLQSAPLAGALGRVCEELAARFRFTASVRVDGDPRPLSHNTEIVLLRAAQEALANVGRHAAASRAVVSLSFGDDEVVLAVEDDGVGFDFLPGAAEGFGLAQLRSRAAQVGGRAEVGSEPGAGTTVRVVVPLNQPRPDGQQVPHARAAGGTGDQTATP